jgi:NTP pyrophosphatase (non-canonical NTP hydrolase)
LVRRAGNGGRGARRYDLVRGGERGKEMNRTEILQKAIDAYGEPMQEDICIEEMSELTKALIKYRRAHGAEKYAVRDNIREEIADVQIMLDQMRMIYGDTMEQENFKVQRLEKRLEKKS